MKAKTAIGYLALVLSITAVATGAFIPFANPAALRSKETTQLLHSVAQQVLSNGITSDLNEYLASGSKPKDWLATVVLRQVESDGVYAIGQAVAASNPRLVGLNTQEVLDHLRSGLEEGESIESLQIPVLTPDGTPHWVAAYNTPRYYGYIGFAWTALFSSIIGAWLAIAAWVVMDVGELQKANVVAWALLSLMAGPVALGVWLISRPTSGKTEPVFCPSCGSTIPAEAAYCVRCGHPILALCPKCGRRVDLEWVYCGSCGTPLTEES
jgi:hypothetical protein